MSQALTSQPKPLLRITLPPSFRKSTGSQLRAGSVSRFSYVIFDTCINKKKDIVYFCLF